MDLLGKHQDVTVYGLLLIVTIKIFQVTNTGILKNR
jgi:hypothetical protein